MLECACKDLQEDDTVLGGFGREEAHDQIADLGVWNGGGVSEMLELGRRWVLEEHGSAGTELVVLGFGHDDEADSEAGYPGYPGYFCSTVVVHAYLLLS